MASRIEYVGDNTRPRQPRRKDGAYLLFLKLLSCPICGKKPVDPAHLRVGNRLLGKRGVGVGERPDDAWANPLCREHHTGPRGQHSQGELDFWREHNINPFQFALALHAAYEADDLERAESIVAEHRMLSMGLR